jgi:hypothetical protein
MPTPEEMFAAMKDDPSGQLGELSKEDFLQFLEEGAAALEVFNKGLHEATKRLLDHPAPPEKNDPPEAP